MMNESIDRDVSPADPTPRRVGVPDDGLAPSPSPECSLCGLLVHSHNPEQAKACAERWREILTPTVLDTEPEYADLASPTGPEGDPVRSYEPVSQSSLNRDDSVRAAVDAGAATARAAEVVIEHARAAYHALRSALMNYDEMSGHESSAENRTPVRVREDITQALVRMLNLRQLVVRGYWCDIDEQFYGEDEGKHHDYATCCHVLFSRPDDPRTTGIKAASTPYPNQTAGWTCVCGHSRWAHDDQARGCVECVPNERTCPRFQAADVEPGTAQLPKCPDCGGRFAPGSTHNCVRGPLVAPGHDVGASRGKVYLAARYSRREELCGYRDKLSAAGYEVTSRWLNGDHQVDDKGLSAEADPTDRERFAREDYEDVVAADTLIAFTEAQRSSNSRGGRHVELGIALGRGMRVYIVGPRENVFCCLSQVDVGSFEEVFDDMVATNAAPCHSAGAGRIEAAARAAFEYLLPTPYRDAQEADVVEKLRLALTEGAGDA